MDIRYCILCKQDRPVTEFCENGRKHYKENRCNRCRSQQRLLRNRLREIAPPKPQACECCERTGVELCLDHDHDTNAFRGWICHECNRSIGQLGDTPEGVAKALAYLTRPKPELIPDLAPRHRSVKLLQPITAPPANDLGVSAPNPFPGSEDAL